MEDGIFWISVSFSPTHLFVCLLGVHKIGHSGIFTTLRLSNIEFQFLWLCSSTPESCTSYWWWSNICPKYISWYPVIILGIFHHNKGKIFSDTENIQKYFCPMLAIVLLRPTSLVRVKNVTIITIIQWC